MNYQRFVSYLYEYEKGVRGKNVGFVKVDCRGEQYKVSIRMKLPARVAAEKLQAHFFYREGSILRGIPFAEREAMQYQCEIRAILPMDFFAPYGKTLPELHGVYISLADEQPAVFASAWDDEPVLVEGFRRAKKVNVPIAVAAENMLNDGEIEEQESIVNVASLETEEPEQEVISPEQEAAATEAAVEEIADVELQEAWEELARSELEGSLHEMELTAEVAAEGETAQEMQENSREVQEQAEEQPQRSPWGELEKNFTKFLIREENGTVECLKVKPHNLALLPKKYWNYGNNSFLLHGYYGYQYIIFGKRSVDESEQKEVYLLGVPGRNRDRERMMAQMYGFSEFVSAGAQKQNLGFWCREIELT
ncbi:MAG: hypothetical protein E7269_00185 [Lachnospiraceae bacterium]|nr:hypothetical protein [Lachnospiraceae bacterium]